MCEREAQGEGSHLAQERVVFVDDQIVPIDDRQELKKTGCVGEKIGRLGGENGGTGENGLVSLDVSAPPATRCISRRASCPTWGWPLMTTVVEPPELLLLVLGRGGTSTK